MFLEHRTVFDEVYGFYTIEKTESLDILVGRDPVACDPTAEQLQAFRSRLVTKLKREDVGGRSGDLRKGRGSVIRGHFGFLRWSATILRGSRRTLPGVVAALSKRILTRHFCNVAQ